MRIARDFGTVSELFPPGVENVRDLPARLFEGIRMAMVFLSFEELPPEERPPRKIWLNDEKLSAWFTRVEADRERERGGDNTVDDPVDNPAARDLIRG